jgi:cyanate lyase
MTRCEVTKTILKAKKAKGVTYEKLGEALGLDKVCVAAAITGQASLSESEATALGTALDLPGEIVEQLKEFPMKGSLDKTVPVDPLIYRFHEIMQVYGVAMKEVIHETFGDGIMSAIDFEIDISKKEDPKGDRVVVTFNGKFLPYRKW